MRETRLSGSEGGGTGTTRSFLPLSARPSIFNRAGFSGPYDAITARLGGCTGISGPSRITYHSLITQAALCFIRQFIAILAK
jgi:hypothetical protein